MEKRKASNQNSCESCEYYDYDEVWDTSYCKMSLDEDEAERFARKQVNACPFYKFYDEYLSVRKQN